MTKPRVSFHTLSDFPNLYRAGETGFEGVTQGGGGGEEGGGDAPEWLPAGAIAYADFVNGHYYEDGAETTLEAMFVEDTNWATWTPNIVNGTGMVGGTTGQDQSPAFIHPELYLAGATWVIEYEALNDDIGNINFSYVDLPGYAEQIAFQINTAGNGGLFGMYNYSIEVQDPSVTKPVVAGTYKVAITLTPTAFSGSTNGAAVYGSGPTSLLGALNTIVMQCPAYCNFKSIAAYPPQLDADLPALSAL